MNAPTVLTRAVTPPSVTQICRYLRVPVPTQEIVSLAKQAAQQIAKECNGRICAIKLPCTIKGAQIRLADAVLESQNLADHLQNATDVVLFAATLGIGADRAIQRASLKSQAEALVLDAAATAAVEALCDDFCALYAKDYLCTRRFSPGYGDLSLGYQNTLLSCLDAHKNIGLTLTDSLLMVPTKSVTAIFGICNPIEKSVF